jgi:hypothetical protein
LVLFAETGDKEMVSASTDFYKSGENTREYADEIIKANKLFQLKIR